MMPQCMISRGRKDLHCKSAPPPPANIKQRPSRHKKKLGSRTRSSPIGPAEHEEGGSLSRQEMSVYIFTDKIFSLLAASWVLRMPRNGEWRRGGRYVRPRTIQRAEWAESYRPKSVSSLLILLRAMVYGVWCVVCEREGGQVRKWLGGWKNCNEKSRVSKAGRSKAIFKAFLFDLEN